MEKSQRIQDLPIIRLTIISVLCAAQALLSLTLSLSSVRYLVTGIGFSVPLYTTALVLLFLLFFAVGAVSAKRIIAPFICSLTLNIIALINYYELRLHGTVLTHQDVRNIATAYRQLGNYKFELTLPVCCIIISFLFLQLVLVFFYNRRCELRVSRKAGIFAAAMLIVLSYVLVYSPLAIVDDGGWSWERKYFSDSFVIGTMENFKRAMRPIIKPAGYTEEELQNYVAVQAKEENYPDIIMILNETYYDVNHLTDFDLDKDVMEAYHELNAYKGYAAVPYIAGGTNGSEYEILTGNSQSLINDSSPFNNLDLENCNSVVKYLKENGYVTMAAHTESPGNYHRIGSWSSLGFDEVFFQNDFSNLEYFGNRWAATDHSAFENFKRFYENMPESQPRFAYLLTIQNHGDWNQNDATLDTVHVGNNEGISEENRQLLNEYLSCIKLTDDFINELTAYFSESDRNVIIYMVGDHCPYMLSQFVNGEAKTSDERDDFNLKKREVPYFIWSNYMDDYSMLPKNNQIDLCALTPYAMKAAGLPISPYYSQLLRLSEHVSCITRIQAGVGEEDSAICFINTARERESIYSGSEDAELVKQYFYMEYNNLQKRDRMEHLFNVNS